MSAVIQMLPAALDPARRAQIIARAQLWPFVVTLSWQVGLQPVQHRTVVVQAPSDEPPLGEDLVPADGRILRCSVLPASRLQDMSLAARPAYAEQFRAWLRWDIARNKGIDVDTAGPWEIDPMYVDESVRRWLKPGVRWTGD